MFKTAMKRGALSFPIGVGASQLVNILISLGLGHGAYLSVLPDFAARFPNELTAVIVQALLTGMLSFTFAASSVFFSVDKWSFLRQCATHLVVTAAVWLPVVWLVWIPRTGPATQALVITAINFVGVYAISWGVQVAMNRRTARAINEKIQSKEPEYERH